MTVKQANDRIEQLINAHVWSRTNDKVKLNVYQRICITQERAALMQAIDEVSHISFLQKPSNINLKKVSYKIPEHLDQRVKHITEIIRNTGWTKPEHQTEPY